MDKVRCAIVGAGWWGTTAHVPAVVGHSQAELVAVQHNIPREARRIARDFNVEHACTTLEEVLAIDGIDAAIVSSVPCAHFEQAHALLSRGIHVLIEKPMTMTALEARRLVELAERKGLHFLISAPWNYTPHSLEAQRLVRSGTLGQIKMISVLMTNFTLGLYRGLSWERIFRSRPNLQNEAKPYLKPGRTAYSDPSLSGGGHSYCQVPHCAGYIAYLTGRKPAEVFARFDNGGTEVDVYDAINLKLDDDTLVSLSTHGATMLTERHYEVRIYGTRGMVFQELWKGTMEYHDSDFNIKKYQDLAEEDIYPFQEPARNLIDCVRGARPNVSPAVYGSTAMDVIDAAVRSARSGKNIVLDRAGAKRKATSVARSKTARSAGRNGAKATSGRRAR